jgi:hypothetical protein
MSLRHSAADKRAYELGLKAVFFYANCSKGILLLLLLLLLPILEHRRSVKSFASLQFLNLRQWVVPLG